VHKTILILILIVSTVFLTDLIPVLPAAEHVYNDKTVETVNCSGHGKGWPACYRQAEALCPGGYTVMEKSTGIVSAPVNGRYTLVPSKKMMILCNK